MSFFKKLFKGIVVGALVGLTGGLALAGLAGLGVTAAVTGVSIATSALFGAVSGGLSVAATAFTKKQRISTGEVQARTNISVDPQTLGKWIFGETAAGTDIVYAEKIADSEIVHVIAAAAHEIDSFGSLYINDELITLSGSAATGDWANVLDVYRNLGTQTQSALSIPSSGWPATARGLGIAHYGLKWNFASDNGKIKLSGGIPTRITQVIRGAKVYDPRLDSTNGGSGSQRANDQSTWTWSANWALIVAHYLLGWYSNSKLIYGVGVEPTDIDWVSVAEMADVCDTVIDSKAKYKIGGIFAISQDHESIIGQLESAVGGKVSNFGGKYYLWCPHNDLVSAGTLTDADIVAEGGIQYTPSGPIENLFNTARGQYVEPSILYQLQPYPEVIEATAVSEDGRDRLLQQDFAMIQDVEIAQRVARELVRRSRFSGTLTVVVGPKGLLVKPFDVITVNFRETNFTNELFRVVSMQYSIGGAVILELLEEDASIYDVTTPLGTSLVQLDPTAYDPTAVYSVSGLALTQVSVAGSAGTTIDGIKISWTQPPGFVDFTEGGFRKTGDPDYIYDRAQRGAASGVIAPVQPGTSYEVRIRHVSIAGVAGPYATASITTGTTTSIGTAVIANNAITTDKINALAVTAAKVAASAIETAKIANLAVEAGKIAANAVTTDKINALAVTAAKVAASAIETAKIADLAVETGKLANAAATEAKIATNAITETKISDNAITTPKLIAGAVTAAKITAGTITANEIAASTITGAKIAAGTITAGNIAALTITASEIAANAITADKILANTITAAKIAAATITAAEIAATTITGAKIAAGTITASNIAALTITASEIAANAITAGKILAGEITGDKISSTFTTTSNLVLTTAGKLYTSGKTSAASTTAGVFLGHDGGSSYDFAVGDATRSIVYDGSAGTFTITGEVVVLGSLKADSSKTFDGSNFMYELGTATTIAGYSGASILRTQKTTSFGLGAISTGSDSFALAGQSTNNAGAGYGGAFVNSTTSGGSSHRTEAYLTNSSQSGLFLHTSTANQVILSNATYAIDTDGDVNVDGDITATGSITPFTGSHDGVMLNTVVPEVGDILVDTQIIATSGISEALARMVISSAANQPAIGVYTGDRIVSYLPNSISEHSAPIHVAGTTYIPGPRVLKPEFADLLDDSRLIGANSVGEGLINVCGEGGDIAAGDLIVTSNTAGKGMKQSDDIVRSRTVAKARQAVTFASPSEVKLIACIYVCG